MNTKDVTDERSQAWVIFSGQADLAWLKILKPGFRHCAVLINDGQSWIMMDPLSNYTDVSVPDVPQNFNLPLWMKTQGHIVVKAPICRDVRPAPCSFYSCVEAVKRVLGIHKRMIFTPWQLYRHLTKHKTSHQIKGDLAWEV